jgi:hypothetical protein
MLALIKALGRLFLMALVMVVVVSASVLAGLAATVSVGLAVVFAGLVGMVGVGRRGTTPVVRADLLDDPEVEAMAPEAAAAVATIDPESLMPRWRRPSLLAARHADPGRRELAERPQMRFRPEHAPTTAELRVVRYAVVPLLDRPDEVLGLQIMDLIAGDEVQVVETSSAFWEVVCPDGERGWVHRTTLGLPSVMGREPAAAERAVSSEADDVLTALLAARGLN